MSLHNAGIIFRQIGKVLKIEPHLGRLQDVGTIHWRLCDACFGYVCLIRPSDLGLRILFKRCPDAVHVIVIVESLKELACIGALRLI